MIKKHNLYGVCIFASALSALAFSQSGLPSFIGLFGGVFAGMMAFYILESLEDLVTGIKKE